MTKRVFEIAEQVAHASRLAIQEQRKPEARRYFKKY